MAREHGRTDARARWQFIFSGEKGRARMVCESYTFHASGDMELHRVALIDDDILEADKKGGCLEVGARGNLTRFEDYFARQSWGGMESLGVRIVPHSAPDVRFRKVQQWEVK